MCLAIPYGRQDQVSGTRVGRWLRGRPARLPRVAGALVLTLAAWPLLAGPALGWAWSLLLLIQGLGILVWASLLERLPGHCRVSPTGYLRHLMLAATLVLGASLIAVGLARAPGFGWIMGSGLLLSALGWRLAACPLGWQVRWCRVTPTAALGRVPRLLVVGLLAMALLALGAGIRSVSVSVAGAVLALASLSLLALVARGLSGAPADA